VWRGAEGCFSASGREFMIRGSGTLAELLEALASATLRSSLTDDERKRLGTLLSANKATLSPEAEAEKGRLKGLWARERLYLGHPFSLWIDWWADDATGGSAMKTWAAKQLVLDIARPMLTVIRAEKWWEHPGADVLTRTARVDGVPFYFDADTNWQSTPRDVGFGLYNLRNFIDTAGNARPLLELAAFVGIQRFRPDRIADGGRLGYSLWAQRLPIAAAAVAAAGRLGLPGERQFAFRILSRTKYMKAFLHAEPFLGG
jgi:CRISPR-associated protein Csb3